MKNSDALGRFFTHGLKAGFLGAFLCGAWIGACFGLMAAAVFNFHDVVMVPGGGLLSLYDVKVKVFLGLYSGACVGASVWLIIGVMQSFRSREFLIGQMIHRAFTGSIVGAVLMTMNVSAFLYYLVNTPKAAISRIAVFGGANAVPALIAGMSTTDFICYVILSGLLLGLVAGSWLGARNLLRDGVTLK